MYYILHGGMKMKTVIGIDIGGSTTKIAAFKDKELIAEPLCVQSTDALTSIYGAFGKFTVANHIDLSEIECVRVTGVGASFISEPIYGLRCEKVPEFTSVGVGGLYLSGLERAIVVSMGTGTAINYAYRDDGGKIHVKYLGGTGVGGGTLMGLSKKMLGLDNIDSIVSLAKAGDLGKIDLRIKDLYNLGGGDLPSEMTASNFGKVLDIAEKSDLALGILNMVFETIAMLTVFAARNYNIKDVVLTGNLAEIPQAKDIFASMKEMLKTNFIITKNAQFGTVVGAALSKYEGAILEN